jgi:hypothetical protein
MARIQDKPIGPALQDRHGPQPGRLEVPGGVASDWASVPEAEIRGLARRKLVWSRIENAHCMLI